MKKNEGTNKEGVEDTFESQDTFDSSYNLKDEEQINRYYLVKDISERYLECIYNYNNYDGHDLNYSMMTEEALQRAIESQKQADNNLLEGIVAEECKADFSATDYNYYGGYSLNINNMYVADISVSMKIYLVYGSIVNTQEEVKLMVVLDNNNSTYEIYPQKYVQQNQLENLRSGDTINFSKDSVDKNDFNTFKYKNTDSQTVAMDYFNNYKNLLSNNAEALYNVLDKEYREKRFGSLQDFQEYLNSNREELEGANVSSYLVNNYDNYTEYVCKDQYENLYIFRATAVMKYSLLLDTYTITTDEFKQQYQNSSNENKVKLNVDKWFDMINNRDYKNAFNYLDETFRTNNLKNDPNTFEAYMRDQYPLHYQVLYGEITSLLTKEGYCFASNRYFADLYGVIPGTISRWISHLERLNFIKVVLIRNEKKQIIQRRIYITDISYNTYIACTYEQNKQYPYVLNEQYPISKKAKDINIKYKIDGLFNYIINNNDEKLRNEFSSEEQFNTFCIILERLELNYTKDIVSIFTKENIEKLKIIIYCLKELVISNKTSLFSKLNRERLINIYDNCKKIEQENKGTAKEIKNFFDYYNASVIKDLERKV